MKKNGFSLIELLGVITIMGLLVVIIIPVVDREIKKGNKKSIESTKESLIKSVKSWLVDNKVLFDDENNSLVITLSTLKEEGYVDANIKHPVNSECLSNSISFTVTKNNKKYDIEMNDEDLTIGTSDDCE